MTDHVSTPEERQSVIVRLLAEHGRLDVAESAELLGVAQETIRRDLRILESAGVLRRVHGGAISVEDTNRIPIPTLDNAAPDETRLADQLWAELPRTGTLMIGCGPMTLALIAAITAAPPSMSGLTVVTNSLDAAVHLARVPTLTVYNIGGTVSRESRAQEGDWAIEELGRLRVDIAVLSPAGISIEHGLSESTPAAAAVAQAAVACSGRRIAVCRNAALGRSSFVRYAGLHEVDEILVAGPLDAAVEHSFRGAGICLTVVDPDNTKGPALAG
jgi:DeoR/GlpR family transcriptional regulator of sugar metabolism